MGNAKRESNRPSTEKDRAGIKRVKGENFYRDAKKVKQVNILRGGHATRDAQGNVTQAAAFQSREKPRARIEPNRKWFGNTRVIAQNALSQFRETMGVKANDSYSVLLQRNKLPMSLLNTNEKIPRLQVVETQPYSTTFGPKAQRKRPKVADGSLKELLSRTIESDATYSDRLTSEAHLQTEPTDYVEEAREAVFSKGQSRRIWNELYKVIDSSDVIIHVLDARDPAGTRCKSVEQYLKNDAPHKHLIYVINKCDLVPTTITAQWVKKLSREYPTLAFHANVNNSFGKGSLIQLLRQFSILHKDKKQISVGFVGYPNTGKSSIINTLVANREATKVAPIPGETKIWQYVRLTRKIYLIDCPGVCPPNPEDTATDILLRGVVRVEKVANPEQYIQAVLDKCKAHHVERTYHVSGWDNDSGKFLELLARKMGKLLKGGEVDEAAVAKIVLSDFLRGKLPWCTRAKDGEQPEDVSTDAPLRGKLGELRMKREIPDEEPKDKESPEPNDESGQLDGFHNFDEDDEDKDADDSSMTDYGDREGGPDFEDQDHNEEASEDVPSDGNENELE